MFALNQDAPRPRVRYSEAFLASQPEEFREALQARRGGVQFDDGATVLVTWDDLPTSEDEPIRVLRCNLIIEG